MKKSIIIISSILTISLVAGSVFASGYGKRNGQGQGMGYNQDCPRYGGQSQNQSAVNDLSQEQRDELFALRQLFVDETYEARAAKMQKQQEMRMLMETSNPDRAKLDKLSDKITKLQQQIRDKRIDFQLAAKKIAPELSMGRGFGQGRGKWSNSGDQRGFQGQRGSGSGCWRYNN